MKKRIIFASFLLMIFLSNFISAFSLSPGITEIDFKPNYEKKITYTVSNANSKEFKLNVKGELAEYAEIDKFELKGDGRFSVYLKLPEEIREPGEHELKVVVSEKIDEELVSGVGTAITLKALIRIAVPFSGRYIKISEFKANDVNEKEPVKFDITLENLGKQDVIIKPKINILQNNKILETLEMKEREMVSTQTLKLNKFFFTDNYSSGNYDAYLIVDYGERSEEITSFRIGKLAMNILNYTKEISIDGIKKFEIIAKSSWNNKIGSAYANIKFFNSSKHITEFKTSSEDFSPWQEKKLIGYFNSSFFKSGNYSANVTLNYYGGEIKKANSEIISVRFYKGLKGANYLIYVLSAAILLIILIIIYFILKRKIRKNEKRK